MSDQAETYRLALTLPPEQEVGVFADFANLWHTPSTFVLDFLAVTQAPMPQTDEQGASVGAVLPARVAARVRIPSEQIFPIIQALQAQADQWLAETGRTEPPDSPFSPTNPLGL